MRVQDVMCERVICCTPEMSVEEVARTMRDEHCGALPVVEDEQSRRVIGVITDRDIVCRAVAEGRNPLQMTVSECMTPEAFVVTADLDLDACCQIMEEHMIRRVPVVDAAGRCIGIISQADIARRGTEHEAAEVLREVSKATSFAHR